MINVNVVKERRFFTVAVGIAVGLAVLNLVDLLLGRPSWQITRLFYLGFESNFPTWFSSMLLAVAAALAYAISVSAADSTEGRRIWQVVSLGFLTMSCDEVAMIHEHLGNTLNKYVFHVEGVNRTAWVVLVGPLALFVLVYIVLKVRKHLAGAVRAKRLLFSGMLVYVLGAFFLEATLLLFHYEGHEVLNCIECIFEELFEMLGILLVIKGLLEFRRFQKVVAQ